MRDLRILKETEEKPAKKRKKPPTLLIAFMGILVFLVLFFLFEEKPTENFPSETSLSKEKEEETERFRSELTPGKMRTDSKKETSSVPTKAEKKPIGPRPKNELTFLKTLKDEKKRNSPPKTKKNPEKAEKITPKKKKPLKTKQAMKTPILPQKSATNQYAVQVASFSKKISAEALAEKLRKRGHDAYVVSQEIPQKGRWHRVRIGHYANRAEAVSVSNRIKRSEKLDSFVTTDHR